MPDEAFEIYKATRPTAIDYSNTPIVMPLRDQDQHLLLKREGWGDHISSYTPADLIESTRISTPEDALHPLKDVVEGYIERIQPEIVRHAAFGMQKLIVDVGLSDNMARFNTITSDSCRKYGRFLWRLIFNLLRQLRKEGGAYKYPITDEQAAALKALIRSMRQFWDVFKEFPISQ
ncbi:hypothetical protein MVEN_01622300 [Mycena venus]|uniref:Uncharacterized protein n=1 Tax=Mycena venus TaxID=2733690 RepID=A0A8H6XT76_9AGAR|nr:hypothetical protein MVEN_01622300 [Mycena venus]